MNNSTVYMNKLILPFLFCALLTQLPMYAQIGVDNTSPHASSVLDLTSTDKGILIPRMTTAQRTAIVSPATSLLVFDTTVGAFYYYNGSQWTALVSSAGGFPSGG